MPNEDDMFAIVPCSHGHTPEEAIITGNLSQVTEYIPQSVARNERDQQLAQAERDAEETERFHDEVRARALQILGNGLTRLGERLDGYETRKAEREEQQRRDEEEAEAAEIEAMLEALPDPDAPDAETALQDAAHQPAGDMHSVDPVDAEHLDPEGEARSEALSGDMPKELERGAPLPTGDYGPTVSPPSKYRDPVAIGGN
jgi:hypothetical protein